MEKLRLAPPSSKLFRKREFTRTVTNTIVIRGPTRRRIAVGIGVSRLDERKMSRADGRTFLASPAESAPLMFVVPRFRILGSCWLPKEDGTETHLTL